jgi:hypothetical protein
MELFGRADQIEVQFGRLEREHSLERAVPVQACEVGRERQRRPRRRENRKGAVEPGELVRSSIQGEQRLVQLDLLDAGLPEGLEERHIGFDQRIQEIERLVVTLAEEQEAEWADHHGAASNPEPSRLLHLGEPVIRAWVEPLALPDLRDEVVVVGVQPLRELEWPDAVAPPRQGEIVRQ